MPAGASLPPATIAEDAELICLGDELPAVAQAFLDAEHHYWDVVMTWRPPAAGAG